MPLPLSRYVVVPKVPPLDLSISILFPAASSDPRYSLIRNSVPQTSDPNYRPKPEPCTIFMTPRATHGATRAPYTLLLHPTPYTLHPTPHTLHPTPYTLHLAFCTLHPSPYTLHPAPCTLHLASGSRVRVPLPRLLDTGKYSS